MNYKIRKCNIYKVNFDYTLSKEYNTYNSVFIILYAFLWEMALSNYAFLW